MTADELYQDKFKRFVIILVAFLISALTGFSSAIGEESAITSNHRLQQAAQALLKQDWDGAIAAASGVSRDNPPKS